MISLISREERIAMLRRLYWDRDVDAEKLLDVLDRRIEQHVGVDRSNLYARILRGYSWYRILGLIPHDQLPEALSDDILKRVWPSELRERYQHARKLLHG
jgi:hypothetical protein